MRKSKQRKGDAVLPRPGGLRQVGTNCEHLAATAHQQNLLVAGMTNVPAIRKLIKSDAFGKVRTGFLLFLRHLGLP